MARRDRWTTWQETPYDWDRSNGAAPQTQGGVILHQIRCIKGQWQAREVQSNAGMYFRGASRNVRDQIGEERYRIGAC